MSRLRLYHTAGCHLCEEAEARVLACLAARGLEAVCLEFVDIAEDADGFARYAVLIPVLRNMDNGAELCWPFGAAEIESVL